MHKCQKRPIVWQKRPIVWQKMPIIWQRVSKEACHVRKRGLLAWQKRPIVWQKRPTNVSKRETCAYKTCVSVKRGLLSPQKRPIQWQKRPIHMAKETYPHTLTYLHTHTYTNYKHTCRPPFPHPLPSLNPTRTCLLRLSPLIPPCRHVPPPFYGGQSDRGV